MRLTPRDDVVVRTPAFPAALLRAIYESPDARATLLDVLRVHDPLRAALRLASTSLDIGIRRWIDDPSRDEGAANGALAYVARCCTRSTPLAACAAVGQAVLGDRTELRCESVLRRRTRPDAAWLYAIGSRYEARLPQVPAARVAPSGLSYFKNGRVEVADVSRSEMRISGRSFAPVAVPTAMNATRALSLVLEAAGARPSIAALASGAADALNARPDDVTSFISKLVETGVLLSEFRIPLTSDPAEALEQVLRRCDGDAAERLAAVRKALRDSDELPLVDAPLAIEAVVPFAAELAPSDHYWQIDASRAMSGTLSRDFAQTASDALACLIGIARPNDTNGRIARAFIERYNEGREVPLLELLDASDGLDFDRHREGPNVWTLADAHLLTLAGEAIARGALEITLTDADVARLAVPDQGRRTTTDRDLPDGYEVMLHVYRDDDGREMPAFTGIVRGGLGWSSARFHDLLELPEAESGDDEEVIAEFVSLPHARRAANVAIRRASNAYEIACGVTGAVAPERIVRMDDIVAGVDNGRVYLRSLRLNRHLRVCQTHALNHTASSRFAKFFAWVGGAPLESAGFTWGSYAGSLPFRPRVSRGGAILAPASWSYPREHALKFFDDAAVAWREQWRVPRFVYLAQGDNRLLIDTDHPLAVAQLSKAAAKLPALGGVLMLQEALPRFGDEVVFDENGAGYFAEVVLSFLVEREAVRERPGPPCTVAPISSGAYLRAPGTEWTYAKFYLAPERMNYFLERQIAELLAATRDVAPDGFFVRYADPDHHIRLRLRAADPDRADELLVRVARQGRIWVEQRVLDRYCLDTYDREIERYGGPDCIDLAERAFAEDSRYVLQQLDTLRRASDRESWHLIDAAKTVRALFDDDSAAHAWLRALIGRRGHIKPDAWKRIRVARAAMAEYDPHARAVSNAFTSLLAAAPDRSRPRIARALYHMHANRLGLRVAEEERLLEFAQALFDGLIASR